jgi:non-heme chloroperoxidase
MRTDAAASDCQRLDAAAQEGSEAVNFKIIGAILRKDVLSLAPLVTLVTLLFLADPIIVRLDLLPVWSTYNLPVILVALIVLILPVFQQDSVAGLTGDWLCRPVPARELVAAKLLLVFSATYLPRALGSFFADLSLGFPLAESFLDAVLLRDKPSLFLLPIFLFTAIVTRSFVQGFGVLFAIFICVFVLPTPFVREPGPLEPGLRESLMLSGMEWLGSMPARLASLTLVACGFWLVYWRRRLAPTRVLLAVTVCVTLFFMVLPMALMPGNFTFALQKASGPAPAADTARISLRSPHVCFPATHRSELASDPVFVAARRGSGETLWDADGLADGLHGVAPNSVAFLTHVEPRGLPLDWRVKLNYVQAVYSAGGAKLYSLRPAKYITDQSGGRTLAHAWMLPEDAVQKLRGAQPQLELTYSLSLLKPREYRVPADAKRHALPGLGYCSAEVDEPGNRIDVDCFSAFTHAAQISAELNEIPASRIYGKVDFAPAYAQWPYSRRVRLVIGSPRLAKHESITVTAWEAASYFDKSLTLPGILGANLESCPLPTSEGSFQKAAWHDAAPHETSSIRVDEGVQLEVLDFGGTGSPILLLPGLGATAHSYDDLAPLLAQKHRVVAMTRRGAGYSSKPDFGYDTPRLAQDVLQVMDAMGLEKVLLVGHSIAGDELTWLGGRHPDRFSGLIYLDAAYDRSGDPKAPDALRLRELGRALPPEPPRPPQAMLNFDAMTKMLLERGHLRLPEGELIAFHRMNDPYLAGSPSIDPRTQQAISAAIRAPDYAAVKIPALAIYAFEDPDKPLPPWYDPDDEELLAVVAERARISNARKRESIELFKVDVEKGQVVEMQNATHYIFQSNQQEVLDAIEQFVAGMATTT